MKRLAATKDKTRQKERARQVLWAGLVALALLLIKFLQPIDQIGWAIQSRVADKQASGEIAFVGARDDTADIDFPERRVELARALDRMRAAGVDRVFVDVVFNQPTEPEVDARLNLAMRAWGDRLKLVENFQDALGGQRAVERSSPAIGRQVSEIAAHRWRSFLGIVWSMDYMLEVDGQPLPSLPVEMAQVQPQAGSFSVFYGFDPNSIPTESLSRVLSQDSDVEAAALTNLAGKTVIIGSASRVGQTASNIPGQPDVPGSLVHVYAAETLKLGLVRSLNDLTVLLVTFGLLGAIVLLRIGRRRLLAYAALTVSLPLAMLIAAQFGVYLSPSSALALLFLYAAMRFRSRWRQSVRLVDEATKLPTFAALEANTSVMASMPAIIVARIHRFDEVRKTLAPDLHGEYIMRIVDRLRAATPEKDIFAGPGNLIAWTMPEKDPTLIRDHLEGLRALFGAPLMVDGKPIDVGITFGVDVTISPDVARRLAGAVSAAETTNETYDPINVSEIARDEDLIWNISLQARIDAALENGEIFLVYQPKVDVKSGDLVGVEALVRWKDPVKGMVPPDHFIRQCENVGRMAHLTRHVLREGCKTGNKFAGLGMPISVAVNISATMLHERAIVSMVHEVLTETGFDPHNLTLEVTETYRISNLDRAGEILDELKALGPKIAMDDFGVGAASLEALMELPFDELKIDRIFTSAITENAKAEGIVRQVIRMGQDIGLVVVAEGIENAQTLAMLREAGCHIAQGYGISRPVAFSELVRSHWFIPERPAEKMV